jgi:FixJ family two-component response regulator
VQLPRIPLGSSTVSLVARGHRLSEVTVKVHRGQVMRRMKAASPLELVRMADRLGAPNTTS